MGNWKNWIHGLIAASISAAAGGVSLVIVDPSHFNLSGTGLIEIGKACGVQAVVAVALYLKTSPLPGDGSK